MYVFPLILSIAPLTQKILPLAKFGLCGCGFLLLFVYEINYNQSQLKFKL